LETHPLGTVWSIAIDPNNSDHKKLSAGLLFAEKTPGLSHVSKEPR
jgi:hypothetical protein